MKLTQEMMSPENGFTHNCWCLVEWNDDILPEIKMILERPMRFLKIDDNKVRFQEADIEQKNIISIKPMIQIWNFAPAYATFCLIWNNGSVDWYERDERSDDDRLEDEEFDQYRTFQRPWWAK